MKSMTFSAVLTEAWISMRAAAMRSFLTMLGIIIGVGAVVLMLAIGRGAEVRVQQSIATMGANIFIVLAGSSASGGIRGGGGSNRTLSMDDADEIATLPGAAAVTPQVQGTSQIIFEGSNWSAQVQGVGLDYLTVREWALSAGVNFDEQSNRSAAPVAILGQTVVSSLFAADEDPVGQVIRIKNVPFAVVGVLKSKGQSLQGQDQDDVVLIPVTTAQRKLFGSSFPGSVRSIMVKSASAGDMPGLEIAMRTLLRENHRLQEDAEDDFTIRNMTAVAESAEESGRAMSVLLGSIAAISLVVGGIGIMNVMLVSVTERTREIGVRKAIGARQRDILLQFLLEAVILSLAGAVIGILAGVGAAYGASALLNLQTEVSPFSIFLSFAVAAAIGVFFGFYPARRAAMLNPIEALRYQ
jgi:putative ABC transport system permease protein